MWELIAKKARQELTPSADDCRTEAAAELGPSCLEGLTFNQYGMMICSKNNWDVFEPMFGTMRELVNADFAEINELRNIVFHFRRSITTKDTDRLRYDREL